MTEQPFSAAAQHDIQPILQAMREVLGPCGTAFEIAWSTCHQVVWFAAALANWTWQSTDADPELPAVTARRIAQSGLPNLKPPALLDVLSAPWPCAKGPYADRFKVVFCANMLHISPPATCAVLIRGAGRHLKASGLLITQGPHLENGPSAPGNVASDQSLRERDTAWGIRRLDEAIEAGRSGFTFHAPRPMPANDLLLVFASHGEATLACP